MVDKGSGPPLVLIPGIQGRWEWMSPTIEALAVNHRVLSFSLTDTDHGESCFDAWVAGIDRLLDRAGVESATLVGVSFGGLVAIRYAAQRAARVSSLVLVSTPSPRWRLDPQSASYLKHPRLALPFLAVRSVRRLLPEIMAARPRWGLRLKLGAEYARRALQSPVSPAKMAQWVRTWMATDLVADCRQIAAPTTVITGERRLDRVVPIDGTLQLLELIPQAKHVVFAGTGHIGVVTRPDRFAALMGSALFARHAS